MSLESMFERKIAPFFLSLVAALNGKARNSISSFPMDAADEYSSFWILKVSIQFNSIPCHETFSSDLTSVRSGKSRAQIIKVNFHVYNRIIFVERKKVSSIDFFYMDFLHGRRPTLLNLFYYFRMFFIYFSNLPSRKMEEKYRSRIRSKGVLFFSLDFGYTRRFWPEFLTYWSAYTVIVPPPWESFKSTPDSYSFDLAVWR